MTFNTPTGVDMKTVQYGPYLDYRVCTDVGDYVTGSLNTEFSKLNDKQRIQNTLPAVNVGLFKASYACADQFNKHK